MNDTTPLKYYVIFSVLAMLLAIGYYQIFHASIPLMQADSAGYILFSSARTMGYPIFLLGIKNLFGDYNCLPLIQLSLHFMAIIFLSVTFYKPTQSFVLSALLFLFLALNFEWVKYDFMLLTESMSGSLVLIAIAFIIRFCQTQKTFDLVSFSIIAGLIILIRPVCYVFIPVLGGLAYLLWPKIKNRIWALVLPLVLVLGLGVCVQKYRNGFWDTESFLGHNLLGKVGIIVNPNIPSRHPLAIEELSAMASPIQETLNHAPDWQMEYIIASPYYDYMRYNYKSSSFYKAHPNGYTPKEIDQYWKEIAVDIIKARPLLYIRDVFINYFALWFLWDFKTTSETQLLDNLVKELYPFPIFKDFPFPPRTTQAAKDWRLMAPCLRGVLMVSFLISLWVLGYVLYLRIRKRPIDTLLQVAFLTSLLAQGLYGLTALLQAGLPRYAVFAWPAIGVMMLSIMGFYWKKYKNDNA